MSFCPIPYTMWCCHSVSIIYCEYLVTVIIIIVRPNSVTNPSDSRLRLRILFQQDRPHEAYIKPYTSMLFHFFYFSGYCHIVIPFSSEIQSIPHMESKTYSSRIKGIQVNFLQNFLSIPLLNGKVWEN